MGYQAFCERTSLFRALTELFPDIQNLANRNTEIPMRCGQPRCGQPVPARVVETVARKPPKGKEVGQVGPDLSICSKCTQKHTPPCIVCGDFVRGVYTACQICGH